MAFRFIHKCLWPRVMQTSQLNAKLLAHFYAILNRSMLNLSKDNI